jgi:nucleoside 2-deoxyribosyltransferase
MEQFVYLAGPVLGMTEKAANDWRQDVAERLAQHGIVGISPLRCEPIHGQTYQPGYPDDRFGTARAIMHKNLLDVQKCDMTLAYLPRPREPLPGEFDLPHHSWGTMAELSWAKALGKPAVLVTDDPKIRAHPVLNASAGWVLDNFTDACDVLIGILGGYTGGSRNV